MAQYHAVVIGTVDESHCLVAIERSARGGCGGCLQKNQCYQSLNASVMDASVSTDASKQLLTCITRTQHEVGERVQVEVSSKELIVGFFWVYLVPVLVLLLVALCGAQLSNNSVMVGIAALVSWLSAHGLQYFMAQHFDWVGSLKPSPYVVASDVDSQCRLVES